MFTAEAEPETGKATEVAKGRGESACISNGFLNNSTLISSIPHFLREQRRKGKGAQKTRACHGRERE